jgi:hypothetical protein
MDWYIPTFWGDIKLTGKGKKTLVQPTEMTVEEQAALRLVLLKESRLPEKDVEKFLEGGYRENGGLEVDAPIAKIQRAIAKRLAKSRQVLSAVLFSNGTMSEVKDIVPEGATKGVTVKQPTSGCPLPDFEIADIRATRVLRAFLTEEQRADFERHQRFVSVGIETGHRYLLTSRQHESYRTGVGLRDLDEDGAIYCVHDWDVPAAEELLALHVHLQVAGGESYLRSGVGAE